MYRDNEKRSFNWLKIFLKVVIAFLLLLLCIKIISIIINKHELNKTRDNLQENLKILDEVAKNYFTEDILPSKTGDTVKVSVTHLIDTKSIKELKDDKGVSCNYDKSFIQVTRLDTEYQIKSYLDCNGFTDYSNTFVDIKDSNVIIKPTSTKKTTTTKKTSKKKTTKKTTTTKKMTNMVTTTIVTTNGNYYQVSFNSNGGTIIDSQTIKKNSIISNVIPTREGYKFIGWYYKGNKFDMKTKINKDYVLVAKWIKI